MILMSQKVSYILAFKRPQVNSQGRSYSMRKCCKSKPNVILSLGFIFRIPYIFHSLRKNEEILGRGQEEKYTRMNCLTLEIRKESTRMLSHGSLHVKN